VNASAPLPVLKDLVLLGGGHSHVAVLKRFGMRPLPGVRVTLVTRGIETPYSGMLPGLVAGHYTRDETYIDLQVLGRFAGARVIAAEATGLDLATRRLRIGDRPPIPYDVLSIDIGSTPSMRVPGAAEHAVPVKPIDRFLERWTALCARLGAAGGRQRLAVVGGGAGGVELLLAARHRLHALGLTAIECALFTDSGRILPGHNASVRGRFERILRERGVAVHAGQAVVDVVPGVLRTADGVAHEVDEVLWTTEAAAAPWLRTSGLDVDDGGFVRVADSLQSVSHPDVFAAGDIAAMVAHPRPKSGVFAVRQGPPLARNLRRRLLGQALEPYRPQRQFLSLVSTGDRYAVASRGPFAFEGHWVWRWKDRIDRAFMRKYQQLPEMPQARVPEVPAGLADGEALAAVSAMAMRCGGCGAKVGASVLSRVLGGLSTGGGRDVVVGLDAPDDAAVIRTPDGGAVLHTVDFFRAMVDDPWVFGRIAATHALGDVYAMGGEPETALAIVTVPHGPEAKVEDALIQVLAGATSVLRDAGVDLVGGHTSEGAELGLGFAVHGRVEQERLLRKSGLRPGDRLILTKALGTGTVLAADMRHRARGRWVVGAIHSMTQSNREAATCLQAHDATACTDVTGFGLLGHLVEMLRASEVDAAIALDALPLLDGAEDSIRAGIFSSLQPENLRLRRAVVDPPDGAATPRFALLFDPQTSGGLLAGVPASTSDACVRELTALGYAAADIGVVEARGSRPEMIRLL